MTTVNLVKRMSASASEFCLNQRVYGFESIASRYGANSSPIQVMNTCTRTGRFLRFGYTNDTGIGGGFRSGITSTSVPSASADESPAYTGA